MAENKHDRGTAEMLDAMPERVVRYRLHDLEIIYCNVAWAAGHGRRPDEVIGRSLEELLTAAERAGLESQLSRLGPDDPLLADEVPRPAPNAPGRWVEWVDQYLPGDHGADGHGAEVLTVGRDVTGRHIAELNLAHSEARFRDLADNSADVVWRLVTEPHPHFDYISPSVEDILGYPPSMFLDDFTRFLDILDDAGRSTIAAALQGGVLPQRHDFTFRCADGAVVVGEMQTSTIPGGLQGVGRDVTELRRLQDSLAALALRDPLTGLANRRLLDELLAAGLERSARIGADLAVAFLDLDGLKVVNDTFGHDAGDVVLCVTARRLLGLVPPADVVARLGGDEFVLVYSADPAPVDLVARVEAALAAPIEVGGGVVVRCPASVGVANTRTVGCSRSALLAAADAAMYDAKRARSDRRAA